MPSGVGDGVGGGLVVGGHALSSQQLSVRSAGKVFNPTLYLKRDISEYFMGHNLTHSRSNNSQPERTEFFLNIFTLSLRN